MPGCDQVGHRQRLSVIRISGFENVCRVTARTTLHEECLQERLVVPPWPRSPMDGDRNHRAAGGRTLLASRVVAVPGIGPRETLV